MVAIIQSEAQHHRLIIIIIAATLRLLNHNHNKMYNFAAQLFLTLSVIGTPAAAADLVGSDAKAPPPAEVDRRLQEAECSCSPTFYTFQLNLDQTCDDNTINGKPGVEGTACQIIPDGDVVDLTPIEIQSVSIGERNPDIEAIGQYVIITGPFFDGDTFSYTSVSAELNPDEPLEDQVEEVPRVIQLNFVGVNAAGQQLRSIIALGYDLTNCVAEPIQAGDTIGWIEVVEPLTPAIPSFCPATQTDPPTPIPTLRPTPNPTPIPTPPPTPKPSPRPTTGQPTSKPTPSPVWTYPPKPTPSPVVGSMSYSASFSLAHMSKASKATKSGKSKSGKLIRGRN